jgi:hypothetical protein
VVVKILLVIVRVNVELDSDVGDAVGSTECQFLFRYQIICLIIVSCATLSYSC